MINWIIIVTLRKYTMRIQFNISYIFYNTQKKGNTVIYIDWWLNSLLALISQAAIAFFSHESERNPVDTKTWWYNQYHPNNNDDNEDYYDDYQQYQHRETYMPPLKWPTGRWFWNKLYISVFTQHWYTHSEFTSMQSINFPNSY